MNEHDLQRRRAFNAGSDARIEGQPWSANPYPERTSLWTLWASGYRDVDAFWGTWSRWPVRQLPEVAYA